MSNSILALDVGDKRIGVAWADQNIKIPFPLLTLAADDKPVAKVKDLYDDQHATLIVVGLPRNQQGQETAQSKKVRLFASKLQSHGLQVAFQDESLTSVLAENELKKRGKPFAKEDVDSLAATLILQDYLHGR